MELTIGLFGLLAAAAALCVMIRRARRREDRELDRLLRAIRDDMESTSGDHPGGCAPGASHGMPTLGQPSEPFPLPGSETPLFAESR